MLINLEHNKVVSSKLLLTLEEETFGVGLIKDKWLAGRG